MQINDVSKLSETGYHEDGVGYNPMGHWRGECCNNTCKDCSVWKEVKLNNPD